MISWEMGLSEHATRQEKFSAGSESRFFLSTVKWKIKTKQLRRVFLLFCIRTLDIEWKWRKIHGGNVYEREK